MGRAHEMRWRRIDGECRADVDDLGVAGPLEHHVGRLDVAVHNSFAMQRSQRSQAATHDRHRHAGFETRVGRSGGDQDAVNILPALLAHARLDAPQTLRKEQTIQVVTVHPLHDHHANSVAVDEVVHVEQVIVLDLSHVSGDVGNATHRFVVGPVIVVSIGGKDFDRYGQRETVCSAAFREVDDALTAGTEHPFQVMVRSPVQTLVGNDVLVTLHQELRAGTGWITSARYRGI